MSKEFVKRPVTFVAVQFNGDNVADVEEILAGTRVKYIGVGKTRLSWPSSGFYENGPSESLWKDDWVVVSSLGEVRVVREDRFEKEFVEA